MKAQLVITLEDDGRVNVAGPLNDRVLAYGLLGIARDVVEKFNEEAAAKRGNLVLAPAGSLPPLPPT